MDTLDSCLVAKAAESVKVIDVLSDVSGAQATPRSESFTTAEELKKYLNKPGHDRYSCRFISICQRTSWSPLQVTRPLLDLIVSSHGMSPAFYELPSCFYIRHMEHEGAFCIPLTFSVQGDWAEISYTIRYPEFRRFEDDEAEWVIRQSGVYQRLNTVTHQSVVVLFSPNPDAAAHHAAQDFLLNSPFQLSKRGPLWMHSLLFSTHVPAWRRYIASLEAELLPIANSTFASYIDEPLRRGYDNLSTLVNLENSFLKTLALIGAMTDALDELKAIVGDLTTASVLTTDNSPLLSIQNLRRQCAGCVRTTTFLQQWARSAAQLLADTLALQDQVIAKEQGASMLQLNKSAVFITTLTLVYLPPSFIASFFGMNFFDMDQGNNRIVGTPMVWIYVVASAVLMAITFAFYYWLLQEHDSTIFRRLAPKARISADWKAPIQGFKRRLSSRVGSRSGNPPPPGVELRHLVV